MLFHVPDRPAAAAEFRRVTRSAGQVLVILDAADLLAELLALAVGGGVQHPVRPRRDVPSNDPLRPLDLPVTSDVS
jgi:hypothetical protein